jgi:putative SOS response-associated peptidase YedK
MGSDVREGFPCENEEPRMRELERRTLRRKDVCEASTMLIMEVGFNIALYHERQIVIPERNAWADWLDASAPPQCLFKPISIEPLPVEWADKSQY